MPQYSSQIENTTKTVESLENTKKQRIVAVVLTILLTVGWWYWWQISGWVTQVVDPKATMSFAVFFPFLQKLVIPSTDLIWYKVGISLIAYMILYALIGLESLLINKHRLRLLPILISSTIFLTNQNDLVLSGLLLSIAVLTQQMFISRSVSSRNLYKKVSLTSLLLPANKYLSIGLSVILVLPLYFHLSANPKLTDFFIYQKVVDPQVDKLVEWSSGQVSQKVEESVNPKTEKPWKLIGGQLEGLVAPEVMEKLKLDFGSEEVPTELLNVVETGDLNELSGLTGSAKNKIKEQVKKQMNQLLNPFVPYLPILIPALIFFTLVQGLILLSPLLFVFPWLMFQFLLVIKIIKISKKEELVEHLELV